MVIRPAPPSALVLASILSVQFGGALAVTLIPLVGVFGSVLLRLALGVGVLLVVARPRLSGYTGAHWRTAVGFGLALAVMNSAFYGSLTRLPIGVAVTVEFLGPLLLAASLSRRPRDGVAVLAAAVGVSLIAQVFQVRLAELDVLGMVLALLAGAAWAGYIVLSGRTGAAFPGLDGLTVAMLVACCLVAPMGLLEAGPRLGTPEALVRGAAVAVLSSVLPYSLELLALRRMDPRVFGILLSLEPAVAALAGLLVLSQTLTPIQLVGMSLVVAASVATVRPDSPPPATAEVGAYPD